MILVLTYKRVKDIRMPCSSKRVNFTRMNLDYLRKERYDPMMEETLNKVRQNSAICGGGC